MQFYPVFFFFIIPMLGIIFNVFYQVDFAGESSSVAHFFFMYLYPVRKDGWMKDCNMSQENSNTVMYDVWVLCLCGFDCYCYIHDLFRKYEIMVSGLFTQTETRQNAKNLWSNQGKFKICFRIFSFYHLLSINYFRFYWMELMLNNWMWAGCGVILVLWDRNPFCLLQPSEKTFDMDRKMPLMRK